MKSLYIRTSLSNYRFNNNLLARRKRELRGRWFATIVICLYFASFWDWDILDIPPLRWYMVLGMALLAFLSRGEHLNMDAARIYWVVGGLGFLGAAVSLFRAPNLELALWNTVAMGINFVSLLLFVPVLASRFTRSVLLVTLVFVAFLWVYLINNLLSVNGFLIYATLKTQTGSDKNQVGLLFSMASTAVFYLAVFWSPSRTLPKWQIMFSRLTLVVVGLVFAFFQVIIYARSGILATSLGIVLVLTIMVIDSPKKISVLFRVGSVIAILALLTTFLLPKILAIAPQWETIYNRTLIQGINSYDYNERILLLQKGLYLIRENPLLGVGLGGSRTKIDSPFGIFPGYFIHNTFLTDWVEKGILGFLADVIWIWAYLMFIRKKFFNLSLVDQIWFLLMLILFFEMNFKEINTISLFMLALFVGISYDFHHKEQRTPVHFSSEVPEEVR